MTTGATSLVFAVGNDRVPRLGHAAVGTLPPGWVPLSQWAENTTRSSYWSVYTNDPTGPSRSVVTAAGGAATHNSWNLVAVELLNDDA